MGTKEIKDCSKEALSLGESLDRINQGLFGAGVIDDHLDKFQSVCKIQDWEKKIIRNVIAEGISSYKQEDFEFARNSFNLSKGMVFGSALTKIKEVL